MSPLPTRRSAPGWSRMTRLSVRLDTAKAMRAGMLALITPVRTLTLGRWVAMTRWMPTARAIWAMRVMRVLHVAGGHHHEVVQLVDHDDDERQPLVDARSSVAVARLPGSGGLELAPVEGGVVAGDVADADLVQQVVAPLHLLHRPLQGVGRLLGVGDHLGEQVGQPVVLAHLDPLRVDQDEPHLVGGAAHQDRGDDAVDAARLARPGGPGDEQVGHGGEVHEHRPGRRCPCRRPPRAGGWPSWPRARPGCRRATRGGGCWLGTSTPMAERPGMGARMRTSADAMA